MNNHLACYDVPLPAVTCTTDDRERKSDWREKVRQNDRKVCRAILTKTLTRKCWSRLFDKDLSKNIECRSCQLLRQILGEVRSEWETFSQRQIAGCRESQFCCRGVSWNRSSRLWPRPDLIRLTRIFVWEHFWRFLLSCCQNFFLKEKVEKNEKEYLVTVQHLQIIIIRLFFRQAFWYLQPEKSNRAKNVLQLDLYKNY